MTALLVVLALLAAAVVAALVVASRLGRRVPEAADDERDSDGALASGVSAPSTDFEGEGAGRQTGQASRPPGLQPPDPARDWTAETQWRQEEGGPARFEVAATADGDERATIAASGPVTWPPDGPEDIQRLNDEMGRLEAELVGAGWTLLPPGDSWYAKRFGWAARARSRPGGVSEDGAQREATGHAQRRPTATDRLSQDAPAPQARREPGRATEAGLERGDEAPARRTTAPPENGRPTREREPHNRVSPRRPTHDLPEPPREAPPIESDEAAARFAHPQRWPEGAEDLYRCEIRWEAGYKTSRFAAIMRAPGSRTDQRAGESQPFKWMLKDEPDFESPLFRAAVRAIIDALEDAGWERIGPGFEWWEQRFLWRRAGEPPSRVQPAPVELEV